MTKAIYKHKLKSKWLLLLAVPIATILIVSYFNSQSSRLPTPYRYSVSRSLPGTDNRRATVLKEINFYREKVSQNPESGLNLASLAQAYLQMAKATGESSWYLLAEQAAKRSVSNLPFNNQGAVIVLARVAQARHDFTEAIRLSQEVLKVQPSNQNALAIMATSKLAMGKLQQAKTAADTLVNKNPTQANLTLQALVQTAQGQEAAIDTFKSALSMEEAGETGTSAYTRVLLGQFHYKHGELELAEGLYEEALRIIPRYPLALLHLAELKTRQGDYKTAESLYAQVLPNSQKSSTTYDHAVFRGKARLKQLQGDRQQAVKLLTEAETLLRQENATGHGNGSFGHQRELARLLLEKNRPQDTAEALSLMQAEIKIRRDAQTLDTLAWALSDSGRFKEAQQIIQEALQIGTKDAAIFYRAATIEKALGNDRQALTYQKLSQQIDPTFDKQARRTSGLGLENFEF